MLKPAFLLIAICIAIFFATIAESQPPSAQHITAIPIHLPKNDTAADDVYFVYSPDDNYFARYIREWEAADTNLTYRTTNVVVFEAGIKGASWFTYLQAKALCDSNTGVKMLLYDSTAIPWLNQMSRSDSEQ